MKKLYFLIVSLLVSIAANVSATDLYLVGGLTGWQFKSEYLFTDNGDGTFTYKLNGTLAGEWKIAAAWQETDNFGADGSVGVLKVGEPFTVVEGTKSKNLSLSEPLANPTITFNKTAMTVLVEGTTAQVEYGYVLWGAWAGGSEWTGINMTENAGKWVAADQAVSACEFGIKKVDAGTGNQMSWISADGDNAVVVDKTLNCKVEGTNFSIAAGTYTFTFDPAAMTLVVTGEGGDTPNPPTPPTPDGDYPELVVVGSFNNWTLTDGVAMTNNNGTYTATIPALEAGAMFKVAVPGANWTRSWGGEGVIDPELTEQVAPVVLGTALNAWEGSSVNFYTENALSNVKITFVYTGADTSVACKLTVTADNGGDEPNPPTPPTPGTVTISGDYNICYSGDKENVYAWGGSNNMDWPGIAMTVVTGSDGKSYKVAKLAEGATGLVFNTNGDENKTGDITYTSEYVLDDNGATSTRVVFEGGDTPNPPTPPTPDEYPTLVVVGSFCNWTLTDGVAMTNNEGTYTANIASLPAGAQFKVAVPGENWTRSWGGEGVIDPEMTEQVAPVVLGTPVNAWEGSSVNFYTADALANVVVTFVYSGKDTSVASTLTVSGTTQSGVEAVAAEGVAAYYNLQGVRVANPERGLYIVVKDGKATKVVL